MANSKYEYVKVFEKSDILLPNTWIVVRIDGRGFHKLTAKYGFEKPNDRRALDLMNAAAQGVMRELPDLVIAYGISDEFSFVFHKDCALFDRRESKLTTTIVSTFTSYYVHLWPKHFPDTPLSPPLPSFDGRAVLYPSVRNLRDYMSWRQVDCHINNLYNTTFWALVLLGGLSEKDAEKELSGTYASNKNEILFSRFGINYNNEPEIYKKGSVLYRDYDTPEAPTLPPTSSTHLNQPTTNLIPPSPTAPNPHIPFTDPPSSPYPHYHIYKPFTASYPPDPSHFAQLQSSDTTDDDEPSQPSSTNNAFFHQMSVSPFPPFGNLTSTPTSHGLIPPIPPTLTPSSAHPHVPNRGPPTTSSSSASADEHMDLDEGTGMPQPQSKISAEKERKKRQKSRIVVEHVDIIKEEFWEKRSWILSGKVGRGVLKGD